MTSPFSKGRYEYDSKHSFYLPKLFFEDLEQHKPVYVIGSRGSGKTTLLMSLNWRERMNNKTLLRQLSNDPFQGLYIGTYVKLPKIQLKSFERWLLNSEEDIHGMILGLYFDLIFLEKISRAVSELLADGKLSIASTIEAEHVSVIHRECFDVLPINNDGEINSMASFNHFVRNARRSLEYFARTRADIHEILDQYKLEQIGVFGTKIAKHIAELCNLDTLGKDRKWHFKVCMDEGECLTEFQQLVMNTIVRLSDWPLFPVVSFVSRPADISRSLVPRLTHQKADRKLIILDDMTRQEFIELAEGVASVRCQEELGDQEAVFKSEVTLGSLNINGLLKRIIEKSENPNADVFINDAKKFATSTKSKKQDELPIYEAYLAKKLNLSRKPFADREKKRHQESQEYRKKMVGAYLSICNELKVRKIPYASAEMVFGISDNCVRDYLSQIDHIYRKRDWELNKFLQTQVDYDTQQIAILAASEEKRDSIPESGVLSPVQVGRVVKGLAIITAIIQGSSDDNRHLRSTERGLFQIMHDGNKIQELDQAMELVHDAADAGFLRIKNYDDDQLFRVHSSLAPSYGFSYRGAYYPVNLTLIDFNQLKNAKTEKELRLNAISIVKHMFREVEDLPLFRNKEENNEQ